MSMYNECLCRRCATRAKSGSNAESKTCAPSNQIVSLHAPCAHFAQFVAPGGRAKEKTLACHKDHNINGGRQSVGEGDEIHNLARRTRLCWIWLPVKLASAPKANATRIAPPCGDRNLRRLRIENWSLNPSCSRTGMRILHHGRRGNRWSIDAMLAEAAGQRRVSTNASVVEMNHDEQQCLENSGGHSRNRAHKGIIPSKELFSCLRVQAFELRVLTALNVWHEKVTLRIEASRVIGFVKRIQDIFQFRQSLGGLCAAGSSGMLCKACQSTSIVVEDKFHSSRG